MSQLVFKVTSKPCFMLVIPSAQLYKLFHFHLEW